jgi:hypothetical protein
MANEQDDTVSGDDRELAVAPGDVTLVVPVRETKIISSVADLLAALRNNPPEEIVWYRGHRITSWTLLPSIARPPRSVDAELTVLKRFKQNAYPFLRSPPFTEWEWLLIFQH